MNIGASIVVKGTITAGEDFTVAGRVEGEVRLQAGTLLLAPGCQIAGDVAAPTVVVEGTVDGGVTGTTRVEVRPGASVAGNLSTPSLLVAEGARLNCRVEMPPVTRQQAAPPAHVALPAPAATPAPVPKATVAV